MRLTGSHRDGYLLVVVVAALARDGSSGNSKPESAGESAAAAATQTSGNPNPCLSFGVLAYPWDNGPITLDISG